MYLANYGSYRLEKKICNCNVAIANRYRQLPKIFEVDAMSKLAFYFQRGFLICPYLCDGRVISFIMAVGHIAPAVHRFPSVFLLRF